MEKTGEAAGEAEVGNGNIGNGNTGNGDVYNRNAGKISQEQIYDMLVSREVGWQAIIYDLIKTEQLDPWDIDLVLLARKYIERIQQLQEQEIREDTFFISSKVLLAAAILLRIKSGLLYSNLKSIDEILFEKKKKQDEISDGSSVVDFADFEEEEFDILPRTPLPRGRKVTLKELMIALDKAINTEHRRIKKVLASKRLHSSLDFVLPKKGIDIRQKIRQIYQKIKSFFSLKHNEKMTFTELAGTERNERIACFLPLLHLDTQKKINLEQEQPFSEIEIWLRQKVPKTKNESKPIED